MEQEVRFYVKFDKNMMDIQRIFKCEVGFYTKAYEYKDGKWIPMDVNHLNKALKKNSARIDFDSVMRIIEADRNEE